MTFKTSLDPVSMHEQQNVHQIFFPLQTDVNFLVILPMVVMTPIAVYKILIDLRYMIKVIKNHFNSSMIHTAYKRG